MTPTRHCYGEYEFLILGETRKLKFKGKGFKSKVGDQRGVKSRTEKTSVNNIRLVRLPPQKWNKSLPWGNQVLDKQHQIQKNHDKKPPNDNFSEIF